MAYEVRLSPRAILDLVFTYQKKNVVDSPPAETWYLGLRDLIFSLESLPYRGPHARGRPTLHQLLYGDKPHVYRILYAIDASQTAKVENGSSWRTFVRQTTQVN
jgi:hypothetical protein